MTLRTYHCPNCNGELEVDVEGRDFIFCQYCGSKILLQNENEHIYHTIDEAKIKHAETEQLVELKKLEMAEKQRQADEKTKSIKIKVSIILAVVGILMMTIGYLAGDASGDSDSGLYMISMVGFFPLMGAAYIWLFSSKKEKEYQYDGKVKIPDSVDDFEHKNFQTIESIFRSAGFTNVRSIALNDLTTGILKKPGLVDTVTVGGEEIDGGGDRFLPDVPVIISYHSFANK